MPIVNDHVVADRTASPKRLLKTIPKRNLLKIIKK